MFGTQSCYCARGSNSTPVPLSSFVIFVKEHGIIMQCFYGKRLSGVDGASAVVDKGWVYRENEALENRRFSIGLPLDEESLSTSWLYCKGPLVRRDVDTEGLRNAVAKRWRKLREFLNRRLLKKKFLSDERFVE